MSGNACGTHTESVAKGSEAITGGSKDVSTADANIIVQLSEVFPTG